MHLIVLFQNIGGYHAARLRAVNQMCQRIGWRLTVAQVTDNCSEYRWGDLELDAAFNLRTLLPANEAPLDVDRGEGASAAATAIGTLLDELRPDAIAIPGWGFPVCRRALRWAKQHDALSVVMSDSKQDDRKRWWWKEQVKARMVRRFDAALVAGQHQKAYLERLGFLSKPIFAGYCVVDNEYFRGRAELARGDSDAARRRDPRIPKRPFFLCATRLIERKNVRRLIEAYAAYTRSVGPSEAWELAVCGSGKEEESIRSLTRERNIESAVHLPGFVGYQQMGDWYGLASAFIHPALDEPWGLVINEACAAGLPILASRTVGACYDLVRDNENGCLFDPGSVNAIVAAMLKVHKVDEGSRIAMGVASQRIVAPFSPEVFAQNLFKAIDAADAFRNEDSAKTNDSREAASQAR